MPDETTDWTIMVYMAAADLAEYANNSRQQLRDAAGDGVAVAAQFDCDQEPRNIHRDIFGGTQASDKELKGPQLDAKDFMTAPETLTDFINWASTKCPAKRYCLILWGHGPELLFEGPMRKGTNGAHYDGADKQPKKTRSRSLTPRELRQALEGTKLKKNQIDIDIIGMDACSMSMVEFASELHGLAKFMVASQEGVPDKSFPYDKLLKSFRENPNAVEELCKTSVEYYVKYYKASQDSHKTEKSPVALSALRLEKIGSITDPLEKLAEALHSAMDEKKENRAKVCDAIFRARQECQSLVAGIFVDIYSFCEHLIDKLKNDENNPIMKACKEVCVAIGDRAQCIVDEAGDERCHGLSIYFPYLRPKESGKAYFDQDFVNEKGILDYPRKNNVRYEVRLEVIQHINRYYETLTSLAGWWQFVRDDWPSISKKGKPGSETTYQEDPREVTCAAR